MESHSRQSSVSVGSVSQWEVLDSLDKEDALQFFKEDQQEDAVYNVYLKKVRYHTSADEVGIANQDACANSRSRFYRHLPGNDDENDGKARLQWRLEEVRVIKLGSLERLVEALGSETGDIDSTYVNTFLATYRSFSNTAQVLHEILQRYKFLGEDAKMKQQHKEGHRKCLKCVLSVWLDTYPEDFKETPNFPCLRQLHKFAKEHMPETDFAQRAKERIDRFIQDEESSSVLSVEDISVSFDVQFDVLQEESSTPVNECYLSRPVDFENIPHKVFAEQLTYVDAELFKKVVPHHCLGSVWSRRDKKRGQAPSVYATVNQFNAVSHRVLATVLKAPYLPPTARVEVIEKWIDVAQELRVLKNFSSLKAILSGLQSNPVYRLHRVWAEVDRDRLGLFKELAEIFSEDNNQLLSRALLSKEGTAKFADPENNSTGTMKGHTRRKSGGWSTVRSRKSVYAEVPQVVQGTVPYLGTFLTDLTMVDTALKDRNADGLINFEKKRKEFELLAQIKLLQSAAHLYRLSVEPAFFEWFHSIRLYDDNECYELSCEIEPVTPTTPQEVRGHRKKSSLGFFSPRRPMTVTLEGLFRSPSSHSLNSEDGISIISAPELDALSSGYQPKLKHSMSTGSLHSMESADLRMWQQSSSDNLVVKVYMETVENHHTNLYKSILVANSDHTKNVLRTVLHKFDVDGRAEDYVLSQVLPDREMQLPERGNVFYAINTKVPDLRFVVRRRSELERIKSRHSKHKTKQHKYKFTL